MLSKATRQRIWMNKHRRMHRWLGKHSRVFMTERDSSVKMPAQNGLDVPVVPAAGEKVWVFEGSEQFKEDLLTLMIRAGNPDMETIRKEKLGFHAFGYLPLQGKARIRVEIFSVWAAEHTTFTMPLKVVDLQKRGTSILGRISYGKLAEVFEADKGIRTYDRFKFLINERPDYDPLLT